MDQLPAEVLHVICANVEQKDLFSLRLASKQFAHIGAYHIFAHGRLWFHLSEISLKRLEDVAKDPTYATQIRTLSYDANHIMPFGTFEHYKKHFEKLFRPRRDPSERPDPPPKDASERTKRLYVRNFEKWMDGDRPKLTPYEWMTEHMAYQYMVEEQKQLILSKPEHRRLAAMVSQLPHLEEVVYVNNARCLHGLSGRHAERFQKGFFPLLNCDTRNSVHQLASMLKPIGDRLKVLKAASVSPRLFSIKTRESLLSSFRSLKKLDLELGLEFRDSEAFETLRPREMYVPIEAGHLLEFLVCADGLQDLRITFSDFAEYGGPCAHISKILGNHSWPHLKKLHIACVEGSADQIIDALTRQPALQELGLGFIELTTGSWCQVLTDMRLRLSLQSTNFYGFLSSSSEHEMMVMEYCNQDLWISDRCLSTLSEEIEEYVTEDHADSGMDLDDLEFANPAARIEDYVDESDLEGYGTQCFCGHCLEFHSGVEEDEDGEEDDDESMPDLVYD